MTEPLFERFLELRDALQDAGLEIPLQAADVGLEEWMNEAALLLGLPPEEVT